MCVQNAQRDLRECLCRQAQGSHDLAAMRARDIFILPSQSCTEKKELPNTRWTLRSPGAGHRGGAEASVCLGRSSIGLRAGGTQGAPLRAIAAAASCTCSARRSPEFVYAEARAYRAQSSEARVRVTSWPLRRGQLSRLVDQPRLLISRQSCIDILAASESSCR